MKNKKNILIATIVAVILFCLIFPTVREVFGGGSTQIITTEIPDGAGTADISQILKQNGIIKNPALFRIISKLSGHDGKYVAGAFLVSDDMSYSELFKKLSSAPDGLKTITVTIPEGYEFRQIVDLLEEKKLIDREVFIETANKYDFDYDFLKDLPKRENRLEGYLFPDTYVFDSNSTEIIILTSMLNRFDEIFTDEYEKRAKELDMTIDEVVTLASVIEREAQGDNDRDMVASVFCNRLKSSERPYLESCATVQYILKERKAVLSTADTKIDSPYNTYINPGLPIGPIASPGEKSIKAALYPAESDYLFFVLDSSGKHRFAKTYEEHLQNAAK